MAKTNVRGGQIADGANGVDLTVDVTGVLPIANGGTNGNSAANARTQLGLVIGTDVQAFGVPVPPRTNTVASSATPAINTDTTDIFTITALATNITSMTTNLTGTPVNGQKLLVRIKDNGTARTIAWGASFISSGIAALPTTTIISKTHMVGLIYDSTAAKWVSMAVDIGGY